MIKVISFASRDMGGSSSKRGRLLFGYKINNNINLFIMVKRIVTSIVFMAFVSTMAFPQQISESDAVEFFENRGDKTFTMEEAIIGRHLIPENRIYKWVPSTSDYVSVVDNALVRKSVKKRMADRVLLTLDELNEMLAENLNGADYELMIVFPGYSFKDENTLVLYVSGYYLEIDLKSKSVAFMLDMKGRSTDFTPSGKGTFAFTRENNLYMVDAAGNETAITADSDRNIVNGQSVSRNEFGIDGGIFWSPDASKLAFYSKDESKVSEFPILDITQRVATNVPLKYPMAGMPSEIVRLGVYDVVSGKTVFLKVTDFDEERYLTNITWSPDGKMIYVQVLNRAQKHMKLNAYDAATGEYVKTVLEEQNDRFVEPLDKIVFMEGTSDKFIYRTDNRSGFKNLYVVDMNGGSVDRLTKVDADVQYLSQDDKYVYYSSAEVSPVERHIFKVSLKDGKVTRLTFEEGWHDVTFNTGHEFFIDNYSSLYVPRVIELRSASKPGFTMELFRASDPMNDYNLGEYTLGTVRSADSRFDNYYRLIKPADFDATKKYPVIIYVYGGPHSQLVRNTWMAGMAMWEMYMAQRGYVVYVQDNRGTQNRGAEFEKAIHRQCGQAEMADQLKGVEFLKTLSYVDADRIGVHGWSYGGFMTISLKTNYPDIFKVAVAGGPVIDWKWYEVMYGERYMDSPEVNMDGYEKVSLVNRVKDLKGKLLICQGVIDPVVVWQHSLTFVSECIKNNIQVDYFPYPLHEHNVRGKDRIHLMDKVTMYFDDYL